MPSTITTTRYWDIPRWGSVCEQECDSVSGESEESVAGGRWPVTSVFSNLYSVDEGVEDTSQFGTQRKQIVMLLWREIVQVRGNYNLGLHLIEGPSSMAKKLYK